MADLVGTFLVNLSYSESPLLPPKLAHGVTPLSESEGGLGDAF